MWNWDKYEGVITGTKEVVGDKRVFKTRWWNPWYLHRWDWKEAIIFQVDGLSAMRGYRVGFRPSNDKAYLELGRLYNERIFAMKIGYEDCVFFALNELNREVPLQLMSRASVLSVKAQRIILH